MSERAGGVMGIFDGVDAAIKAIGDLRAAGLRQLTVFSPAPDHNLEHALHLPESPVRIFTLVGGLTGAATGFALPTWTSLSWPLVTGGKPIISIPAWVIIAFELTILFGALSTVLGLFIAARLPRYKPALIYDASFSSDHYGVYVAAPAGKESQARSIMSEAGAAEIREGAQGATHAV
jgi:hypothetical protein